MACKLDYDKNGNAVVKGENAPLFNRIMSRTGNEEQAIKMWAVAESVDFKLSGISPTEENILKFIELNERVEAKPFKGQEVAEAINVSLGVESFQSKFDKAFTNEKGEFEIDFNRVADSGLFSMDEVERIFQIPAEIKSIWLKQKNNPIPTLNSEGPTPIVIEDEYTSFGIKRRVNPDKIVADIVRGEEYEDVPQETVEQIKQNKSEVVQYVINPLTNSLEKKVYNNTYNTLLHAIPAEADVSKLKEVLDFLVEIPSEDYIANTQDIKDLFAIIDVEAGKIGIDFVGIKEKFNVLPTEGVMSLIAELKNIVDNFENITEEDVKSFSEVYDEVFGSQEFSESFVTEKVQNEKSVVRLKTKDRATMFQKYGLVRIKDGFFRKVKKSENIFEDIYNSARDNGKNFFKEQFPVKKRNSVVYKQEFIKRLQDFADKKISEYPSLPLEEARQLVILEEFFKESDSTLKEASLAKFKTLSTKNNIKLLEEGQSAVIRKIIEAKRKGNPLPLVVSQTGVELQYEGDYTTQIIQDETILDVLAINGEIDGFLSRKDLAEEFSAEDNKNYERNFYLNNPEQLSEFKGNVEEYGEAVVAKSKEDFIKVGGQIYEKVGDNVYQLLEQDGLDRWDRKAPKQTFFPKKKTPLKIGTKFVAKPKVENGVELYNPLLSLPTLTEEEADRAYKNVYSDGLLDNNC